MAIDLRDKIQHPSLRRLYEYWDERRRGRRFPARRDIDPVEFKFALGNVTLVDVLYDPLRFRYRLVSTLQVHRIGGVDLTGKMVEDVPDPAYRQLLLDAYRQTVESGQPNVVMHEQMVGGQPYQLEVIRLPLADDGEKIDMLLVCPMYFKPLPNWSPVRAPPPGTFSLPRSPRKK